MKFIAVVFVFVLSSSAFGQLTGGNGNQVKKVAILEVADKEGTISYGVKLMLRSNLSAAVTNTSGYEGYDRVDVASIMGEQNFQRTGMVSDVQIKRLGEMTGASYILVAEAAKLDESHLFITAKILEVESAKLERTASVHSGTTVEEFEKACRQLALSLFNQPAGGMASVPAGSIGASGEDFIETVFGINMKMVYVAGGTFSMGATKEQGEDAYGDEKPVHRVTLSDYYIGKYEVTQGLWEKVMGTTLEEQQNKSDYNYGLCGKGANYPMYYVNWEEAQEFCEKLSQLTGREYALPTEAQWEYAARGGVKSKGYKYSGGNTIADVAWYSGNRVGSTHTVGTKQPNELGIYDMSGNVWEWCSDWHSGNYYDECKDGVTDPVGPAESSGRVERGGSWFNGAEGCRVSSRDYDNPGSRCNNLGFRLVLVP